MNIKGIVLGGAVGLAAAAGIGYKIHEDNRFSDYSAALDPTFNPAQIEILDNNDVPAGLARELGEALGSESIMYPLAGGQEDTARIVSRLAQEHPDDGLALIVAANEIAPIEGYVNANDVSNRARSAYDFLNQGGNVAYLQDVFEAGVEFDPSSNNSVERALLALYTSGVTPEYAKSVVETGVTSSPYQLSALKKDDAGIEYITLAAEAGITDPAQIIAVNGTVPIERVRQLAPYFSGHEMPRLSGIDIEYIQRIAESHNISLYEGGVSEYGRTSLADTIRDLDQQDVPISLIESLAKNETDSINAQARFLSRIGEAFQTGLTENYVNEMKQAGVSSEAVLKLYNIGAEPEQVRALTGVGYTHGIDTIIRSGPETIDFAVALQNATQSTVFGPYVSGLADIANAGASINDYIVPLLEMGVDGAEIPPLFRSGYTVDQIGGIVSQLPMLDQHIGRVLRAGITPEMIPQILEDENVAYFVNAVENDLVVSGGIGGTVPSSDIIIANGVNPINFVAAAAIRAARDMNLIE